MSGGSTRTTRNISERVDRDPQTANGTVPDTDEITGLTSQLAELCYFNPGLCCVLSLSLSTLFQEESFQQMLESERAQLEEKLQTALDKQRLQQQV